VIAILVPVLGRPHEVAPLLESIAVTKEEHTVYFLCSPNDRKQIAACEASDAEVIVVPFRPGPADFARKINYGFDVTEEPWLFQAADDIRFSPDWERQALAVATAKRVGVIGTNDLGNPLVIRGRTSTHTLFERKYIEEYGGGTVDGSGRVFCELYDHQYVDSEFIQTAQMRKQWAFSRGSVVEHFHPHWGKAQMDNTYKKAMRATVKDRGLYQKRLSLINQKTAKERRVRR
jgi:Glycosyltransferase like family 2